MMGIPARTNDYGRHEYRTSYTKNYNHYLNGSWVGGGTNHHTQTDHVCYRDRYTKNPLRLLPGTTTKWRDPSPYDRGVASHTWGEGVWTRDEGNGHTWEYEQLYTWDRSHIEGQLPSRWAFYFEGPYASWDDYLVSGSIAQAIEKMKGKRASVGEALAESRKTIDMIWESGTTLLDAAYAVKHGNYRRAWSILKDDRSVVRRGADLYLQYKYGWRPLMSDIYGLAQTLGEQFKPALLLSATGLSVRDGITFVPNGSSAVEGSGWRQARTKLYGMVNGDVIKTVGDRLGLTNPLSLGWELIPYSFVVDWFAPVGSVLDTLVTPKGVDFVGGFSTMRAEVSVTCESTPAAPYQGPTLVNTHKGFSLSRRVYTDWPKAGLYKTEPFSIPHGLSAFALTLQRFFR